jgi:hypothetical protein
LRENFQILVGKFSNFGGKNFKFRRETLLGKPAGAAEGKLSDALSLGEDDLLHRQKMHFNFYFIFSPPNYVTIILS